MTSTNLEQMPFTTNGQKDQFRDTALRREQELLADIEKLESAVVHAASIPVKSDAIKFAERVVEGVANPLTEIKAQAVEEATKELEFTRDFDGVIDQLDRYANNLRDQADD